MTAPINLDDYVSVPDAAERLGRSRTLVYKLGKAGVLVLTRQFGILVVTRESLEAELARREPGDGGEGGEGGDGGEEGPETPTAAP